ncbi:MAG: hypothetical protein OXC69_08285 [Candidatus Tectomicrobia bacterium]|nr:hypothetical protein [Candidatus Tectomicrobia bacterium]
MKNQVLRMLLPFLLTALLTACGGGGGDDGEPPPPAPTNLPPTVSIMPNPQAEGGSTVTLEGTARDSDGTVEIYAWTQVGGTPTVGLSGADTASATFTAPMGTTTNLTFRLTVTDDDDATASAEVTVAVNQPPAVSVGATPNPADGGAAVELRGGAVDAGGVGASFAWEQIGGRSVDLSRADNAIATFTAPRGPAEDLTFRLTVTDDGGAMASAEVTVTVNRSNLSPELLTVEANPNPADGGVEVMLIGTAHDEDGTVASFVWEEVGTSTVDLDDDGAGTAKFIAPTGPPTDLTFRLTVTDNEGATASADVTVAVNLGNQMPNVQAHVLVWGFEVVQNHADAGDAISLVGSASDPEDDQVDDFVWEQVGGTPEVQLNNKDTQTATFIAPVTGATELTFRLTAKDSEGAEASVEVMVRVEWYAEVSAGGSHTCGVRESGAVSCWGANDDGQSTPPSDMFLSVSAGEAHTCGVTTDMAVKCWGDYGPMEPPSDMFLSASAGGSHTCGVTTDGETNGEVECWGEGNQGQNAAPEGPFMSVSAGESHTCGVTTDSEVKCWGSQSEEWSMPPGGKFESVSAGSRHTCGVRDTGAVECWGDDDSGQSRRPVGAFMVVDAATEHTCGVLDTGDGVCWGMDFSSSAVPPSGLFDTVSAGHRHTCWLTEEGTGVCRGEGMRRTMPPTGTTYRSVSAGEFHTCWVTQGGFVQCFDDNATVTLPGGMFHSVSAGDLHTCGVRTEDGTPDAGTAVCWGDQTNGRSTPPPMTPPYTYDAVSAGGSHTCGVRADDGTPDAGTVVCWGDNGMGRSTPPLGTFESVSAGRSHTCGVRADDGTLDAGTVVCWGDPDYDVTMPPGGKFESVSAGSNYTCGLREDGTVQCWGKYAYSP